MSRRSATTIGRIWTTANRFSMVVSQIAGKRLTYSELTGKVGETEPPVN